MGQISTKKELIDSSLGKLFGEDKGDYPCHYVMMDRILHISDKGGKYGKGEIKAELDVKNLYGLIVISKEIPLCQDV